MPGWGANRQDVMAPTDLNIDPIFLEAIQNLPDGISIFDADGRPILHNHMSENRFPHLYAAFAAGAKTYDEAMRHSVRKARPDYSDEQVESQVARFRSYTETGETYEVKIPDGRIVQITFRDRKSVV